MPLEVPRYDEPQVRQAPVQGPRAQPRLPIEAAGGGNAAAGVFHAAGDLAQTGGKINEQAFNRDAEASIRDYMGQLSAEETRLKVKMRELKGSNAFGATDQALKEFDQSRDKLLRDITNPLVKDRVGAHADAYRKSLFEAGEIYVAGQREEHDKLRTAALVANERNNAVTGYIDPDSPTKPARVMAAIARQRAAVADRLRGQDRNTVESAQATEESRTHMDVLDRMLVGGNDALAREYYAANQAGFYGDDKTQAERKLQAQSTLGAASRLVDGAFTDTTQQVPTGGNNWTTTGTAAVKTIEEFRSRLPKDLDPKTKELALDLARARFRDIHVADEQHQDGIFGDLWNRITTTGVLPLGEMTVLSPERQRALSTYAKMRARGEEPETDPAVLTDIYALPKGELAKMSKEQLLATYKNSLSPTKYDWLLDRWAAARDQKGEKYQSLIGDDDRILRAAQGLGLGGIKATDDYKAIKEKPEKSEALWRLREAVDARMVAFHADKKVNPDDKQKADIVAGVVRDFSKKVIIEHYDSTGQKDAFTDDYGNRMEYPDQERRIAELSAGQIRSSVFKMPWSTRQSFFNVANSAGLVRSGTSFKAWEDSNRERVNLAFLALELGGEHATDQVIERILTTGK